MKLRILSLFLVYLLTGNYILSQWIQTNGPYGSTNVSEFITYDSLKFVATNCGLFNSSDINTRWNFKENLTFSSYTYKGDSIFTGADYSGVYLIDLSQLNFRPVSCGLVGLSINSLASSDSCLFAGITTGGFFKSVGFTDTWQVYNQGLPSDTGYIPPKYGGGIYLIRDVYSVENNSQYIFAGTQRGIFRTNPGNMIWESINAGLPLKEVSLIECLGNIIYICTDNIIYKSDNNGESWELVFTSTSEVTSINEIENTLYITTKRTGIYQSQNNGDNWDSFNNGLDDLKVNFIGVTDTTLVCGTFTGGFYHYEQGQWIQNNSGIICSSVRSIVTAANSLIANDFDNVYLSDNWNDWIKITPDVNRELFGSMASMRDTVFLSVEYDTPSWPYDQPFILYTPDKGCTWEELYNPVPFARDDPYGIYCSENRLYTFEDELMYYTDNLGSTWTEINLPGEYCNYFYDFLIYNSTPFAAACGNAQLVKLNENEDWILSNTGLPDDRGLSGLAYCEGALFAYVDVYGMYVSMDNGNTWNPANNGLNIEYGIRSFVPYGGSLFITTENGIFYTDDYGQKWNPINSGLINKNLSAIAVFNDTLFVGTYGNGIWKCAINKIPLSIPDQKLTDESISIYPNPASEFIYISNASENRPLVISIFDLAGRKILSGKMDNNELNISELKEGTYIISVITDEKQTSGKLIIIR
jgi:photosystem II stability/assembly factor-like uncharacterized protein